MNSASRIIIVLFLLAFGRISAQDSFIKQNSDSLNALMIQKYKKGHPKNNSSPIYISVGEKILIRTSDDLVLWEGILTGVTDSSLIMDDTSMVEFENLMEISYYSIKKKEIGIPIVVAGVIMTVAGGLMIVAGYPFIEPWQAYVGAPLTLTGIVLLIKALGIYDIGSRKLLISRNLRISGAFVSKKNGK